VVEHINNVVDLLNSRLAHLIGLFGAAVAAVSPSIDVPIDVMQYVLFSIGHVQFPVQSLIAIAGAMTGTVIACVSLAKFISDRIKKDELDTPTA